MTSQQDQELPVLEVVWLLQKESIIDLEELLMSNSNSTTLTDWLCNDLQLLCHVSVDQPDLSETCREILSNFVTMLVRTGFCEPQEVGKRSDPEKLPQVCYAVLDRMLSWILCTVSEEKEQKESPTLKAAAFWINVFDVSVYRGTISLNLLRQFYVHSLTHILTFNPMLKGAQSWKNLDLMLLKMQQVV
nr:PREDICTED: uncharacterized protein LOC106704089 [Latimeria chalumnae]|eukprot:XP_014345824.1 PREDICTED: uncharacterized protein LOC106704089 [Latimeria chalumnae]